MRSATQGQKYTAKNWGLPAAGQVPFAYSPAQVVYVANWTEAREKEAQGYRIVAWGSDGRVGLLKRGARK